MTSIPTFKSKLLLHLFIDRYSGDRPHHQQRSSAASLLFHILSIIALSLSPLSPLTKSRFSSTYRLLEFDFLVQQGDASAQWGVHMSFGSLAFIRSFISFVSSSCHQLHVCRFCYVDILTSDKTVYNDDEEEICPSFCYVFTVAQQGGIQRLT